MDVSFFRRGFESAEAKTTLLTFDSCCFPAFIIFDGADLAATCAHSVNFFVVWDVVEALLVVFLVDVIVVYIFFFLFCSKSTLIQY